jgi:hypothetical protein
VITCFYSAAVSLATTTATPFSFGVSSTLLLVIRSAATYSFGCFAFPLRFATGGITSAGAEC